MQIVCSCVCCRADGREGAIVCAAVVCVARDVMCNCTIASSCSNVVQVCLALGMRLLGDGAPRDALVLRRVKLAIGRKDFEKEYVLIHRLETIAVLRSNLHTICSCRHSRYILNSMCVANSFALKSLHRKNPPRREVQHNMIFII